MDDEIDLVLAELVEAISRRHLWGEAFPIVHVGVLHVRRDVAPDADTPIVATVTGVTEAGSLEPIGIGFGDSNDVEFWEHLLAGLTARGLHGVRAVCSAKNLRLREVTGKVFPDAVWYEAEALEDVVDVADAVGLQMPEER